ncbi:MAG TPA: hypothetical protein VHM66_04165 [Solirubrobacterales bacterium]|nr:hypothetical protein [Solirubrobacterales bacterium]
MNRTQIISSKIARRAALALALAGLVAAMVAPASGFASVPVQFGAKLSSMTDPANSTPARPCDEMAPGKSCTIIENEARERPDSLITAPKSGTIKQIRLVAGGPGSFQLQIAQVKRSTLFGTNEAKVIRNGPVIHYTGQTEANFEESDYNVESFKVSVPVKKGQYLAIKAKSTSALYCSGGGNNILTYQPSLTPGGNFRPATSTDGCDLLLGATIK